MRAGHDLAAVCRETCPLASPGPLEHRREVEYPRKASGNITVTYYSYILRLYITVTYYGYILRLYITVMYIEIEIEIEIELKLKLKLKLKLD